MRLRRGVQTRGASRLDETVAQRTGNTWVPIPLHALANLPLTLLVVGVARGGAWPSAAPAAASSKRGARLPAEWGATLRA